MNVIIVGCGRVGSELAGILSAEGHHASVIDKNRDSFERLADGFNGRILPGNGFDLEVLKAADIERADVLCAVTSSDNTNLISAQVARKVFRVPRVLARACDPRKVPSYAALGVDIISGTTLLASMLRDKILESRFSSALIEIKDIGVIEIEVKKDLAGRSVRQVNIPGEFLVTALRRRGGVIIPDPDTVLEEKNVLMAVVKVQSLRKIRAQFNL